MSHFQARNLFYDLYMKQVHMWAKEKGLTGKGVKIAVLDTGIIRQTEFLRKCVSRLPGSRLWRRNTTDESNDAVGTHGTEVALLIHLIAPEAIVYDLKTACVTGRTLDQYVIDALDCCVETVKPDIINISLGVHRPAGCNGLCDIDEVVNDVADQGILVVASAGNRGQAGPIACPANAAGAIAVGGASYKKISSGYDMQVADISSWSWRPGKPELLAPSDIPVRVRYYYNLPAWMEITVDEAHLGTSYAAPYVSGALALLLQLKSRSRNPDRFASDVKSAMVASAKPIRGFPKLAQGNGVIDISGAASILGVRI